MGGPDNPQAVGPLCEDPQHLLDGETRIEAEARRAYESRPEELVSVAPPSVINLNYTPDTRYVPPQERSLQTIASAEPSRRRAFFNPLRLWDSAVHYTEAILQSAKAGRSDDTLSPRQAQIAVAVGDARSVIATVNGRRSLEPLPEPLQREVARLTRESPKRGPERRGYVERILDDLRRRTESAVRSALAFVAPKAGSSVAVDPVPLTQRPRHARRPRTPGQLATAKKAGVPSTRPSSVVSTGGSPPPQKISQPVPATPAVSDSAPRTLRVPQPQVAIIPEQGVRVQAVPTPQANITATADRPAQANPPARQEAPSSVVPAVLATRTPPAEAGRSFAGGYVELPFRGEQAIPAGAPLAFAPAGIVGGDAPEYIVFVSEKTAPAGIEVAGLYGNPSGEGTPRHPAKSGVEVPDNDYRVVAATAGNVSDHASVAYNTFPVVKRRGDLGEPVTVSSVPAGAIAGLAADRAAQREVYVGERDPRSTPVFPPASSFLSASKPSGRDSTTDGDLPTVAASLNIPLSDVPGSGEKGFDSNDNGRNRPLENIYAYAESGHNADLPEVEEGFDELVPAFAPSDVLV